MQLQHAAIVAKFDDMSSWLEKIEKKLDRLIDRRSGQGNDQTQVLNRMKAGNTSLINALVARTPSALAITLTPKGFRQTSKNISSRTGRFSMNTLTGYTLLTKVTLFRTARSYSPNFKNFSHNRKVALTDFLFQLGYDRASKFVRSIHLINIGAWEEAADNMLKSLWAKQTPNRAKRVTELLRDE